VIRAAAVTAALAAALFAAPAAGAATYVVNDPGEATDPAALAACTPPGGAGCTLPAAIVDANATTGVADTITFTGAGTAPGPFTSALPNVTDPLTINGGGNTTVTFGPAASGTLLNTQAASSTLRSIVFTGGGAGTMLNLGASGDRLDTVTVRDAPSTAVQLSGPSERVDSSRIQNTGSIGIRVNGASATISSPTISGTGSRGIEINGSGASVSQPEISGAAGAGIVVNGNGASISGGHIHGNSGDGVTNAGQNNSISSVVFFGNGGKPIANILGANGGIAPPQNLRIGPRRADGSLPLTGTASGSVELWSGDPSTASAPSFVTSFSSGGDFTYNFGAEPAPGSVFAASVTGGSGTSEFATVSVPSDVSSPMVNFARALDTSSVRVDFSESLDPGSVQPEDFKLNMAGVDRTITGAAVSPDGKFVTLTSSGWQAGEAGTIEITTVGAMNDAAGNAMVTAPRMRVAAAPGDFVAPLGARLSVTPRNMCLTRGRGCRRTGMIIKFVASEPGKARLLVMRSNKTVGSRLYSGITAGPNTLKFNGRLNSRKLRAGRYRLLMYVQDKVGNITDQPPIVLFTVRRVSK
jgi:hypothetical protein